MKSHDLAQALTVLARMLKSGPNVEIAQLRFKEMFGDSHSSQQQLALNLSTLVSLSSVDKSRWLQLIRENRFPIEVRPRDGSRDIFGKLCAYLEENPQAQDQLKASANRPSGQSSPELMKALATLLKDTPKHDSSNEVKESPRPDLPDDQKDTPKNEPPTEGN